MSHIPEPLLAAPGVPLGNSSPDAATISLVHVVTDSGFRAGFRVGGPYVITVQTANDSDPGIAVVDDVPMQWMHHLTDAQTATWMPLAEFPRVRSLGGGYPRKPNQRVKWNRQPAAEQILELYGFDLTGVAHPLQFWATPARRVCGRVNAERDSLRAGTFEIAVERGNYSGWLGGPVVMDLGNSVQHIVGVIIQQSPDTNAGSVLIGEILRLRQ